MDIRTIYRVEVRPEGSEKTLILIDKLTEAEAYKVFAQLVLPTRGKGYEKLIVTEDDMILRKRALG